MRIAVFHNLPFGGALRVLYEQLSRLDGIVTDVYTLSDDVEEMFGCSAARHVYSVKQHRLLRSPFGKLNGALSILNLRRMEQADRMIAEQIDRESFDLVFVHNCKSCQTPPLLKFLKTPSIYYCQEPFRALLEAPIKGGPFISVMDPLRIAYHTYAIANEAAGLAASDLVLCNSYFSRESLVRHYGINAKVNYLGVDADVFHPRKKEKQNLVLSVGRLSLLKGHEFCMRSLTCIDESRRPVLGIVCGPANPDDKARINSTAVGLGVSIEIYEAITDDQLIDLYNSALVTLVAPVLEPFGLVPLESMACGTPVVAVAEGGIRESVVNGETGILTNRDEREFAEAIERIIGNSDLAREMGAVGREHVIRNWNWDSSIHCLKSQFDAVLSGAI